MDFEHHLEPIYAEVVRMSRALAGSKADGDDVLQDALVKAWRAYPRLRDKDRFKPWLLKIIGNTWRSWLKKRRLKRWLSLDFAHEVPAAPMPDPEHADLLRRALQDLPVEQREALVLFELTGASLEDVARIQNASLSAVKSRLARGRTKLRDSLHRLDRREARHAG